MKKILLVYAPFCTPASPPYSLTALYSFLKVNCDWEIDVLDLNLEFHKLKFSKFGKYFKEMKWDDYEKVVSEYDKLTKSAYSLNNKKVVDGEKPDFFEELLRKIKDKKPDMVAFSIVYSSQAFYAYSLIKELDVKVVVGGSAVNEKLAAISKVLKNDIELVEYLNGKAVNFKTTPDFSVFPLDEYFTPYPVIPIRTSSTCFYKKCTFCAHYNKVDYFEFDLDVIKELVIKSGKKHFFIIDDMLPVNRLLELGRIFKKVDARWACQLRPRKELNFDVLKELHDNGLVMVLWGVESGSQRILNLMKKGTNVKDVVKVLEDSHRIGIKNVTFILFGFPSETKEEFLETVDLLVKNSPNIDLISSSIFGLHKGTPVYENPVEYGVSVIEEERSVLGPKISYALEKGLTHEEARQLRKNYKKTFDKINKFPKGMNFFREHMICRN